MKKFLITCQEDRGTNGERMAAMDAGISFLRLDKILHNAGGIIPSIV